MIKNERQYRVAAAAAARFEKALASRSSAAPPDSNIHQRFWDAEQEALASQLTELRTELEAYDSLRTGQRQVFQVRDLTDVPRALIEGRIVSGLTQRDLAVRLGLQEQAIQRYEASDYSGASLDRLAKIADAIGVELFGVMSLSSTKPNPKHFFQQLKEIGLDRQTILHRLLPPRVASALASPPKEKEFVAGALFEAAAYIERIFKIDASELFGDEPIRLNPAIAGGARFKRRKTGARAIKTNEGYAVFAHYLALLTLQATAGVQRKTLPATAKEWRSALIKAFGSLDFEHVVRFLWSSGIPVLPLRDTGYFHGACWRTGGREVIVLKQRSQSEDRWVFDALHEAGHIVDEPSGKSFAVIEDEVPSTTDPAEERATHFAADIVLKGKADTLAESAVELANGDIRYLERAAERVAQEANVPVGALANYLAFRMSKETAHDARPINWWGTAERLQRKGDDPWRIARNIFLENVDLGQLNDSDRALMIRALAGQAVASSGKTEQED